MIAPDYNKGDRIYWHFPCNWTIAEEINRDYARYQRIVFLTPRGYALYDRNGKRDVIFGPEFNNLLHTIN